MENNTDLNQTVPSINPNPTPPTPSVEPLSSPPTPQPPPSQPNPQAIIPPASSQSSDQSRVIQESAQNDKQPKKSKLKLIIIGFIAILAIAYGALFVLDKVVGKGVRDAGDCLASELEMDDEINQMIKEGKSETERLEIFCATDEASINRLISCLEKIKTENYLSGRMVETFTNYRNVLEENVSSHNEMCPSTPISLP